MIVSEYSELLFDLARLLLGSVVLLTGLITLRRLRRRRGTPDVSGVAATTLDHNLGDTLWFLLPSLVMSFFCLACWWHLPGAWALLVWLLLLALPAVVLKGVVQLLIRARIFPKRNSALVVGSLSSLAGLIEFVAFSEFHPDSLIPGNPTSPFDTLRAIVLILTVGTVMFVLPAVLAASASRWFGRGSR